MISRAAAPSKLENVQTSTQSGGNASGGPIAVEIRGLRLTVVSDRDAEFVASLAGYLDRRAAELQGSALGVPLDRLMILAGMSVVEELFQTQAELEAIKRQLQERAGAMARLLEEIEARPR